MVANAVGADPGLTGAAAPSGPAPATFPTRSIDRRGPVSSLPCRPKLGIEQGQS